MKDNGVVCMLAWNHMAVSMKNQARPCCRFQIGPDEGRDEEIVEDANQPFDDKYRWLRKNMLEGKKSKECSLCYAEGNESMRWAANNVHFNLEQAELTEDFDKLRSIELSLDNLCNLQCKMCDSLFSSQLYYRDDHLRKKKMGGRLPTKIPKKRIEYLKELNVDWQHLTKIKVLGGEPFFSPNFPKLIDWLIEKCKVEDVLLEIITNSTNRLDNVMVEKLNRFRKIILTGSIDGTKDYNNYQRWGSPGWKESLDIYEEYLSQLKNIEKGHIHCTYSILTLNGFADDMDYYAKNHPTWSNSFKFVDSGEYSPHYGPDWYYEWILDKWDSNEHLPDAQVRIDRAKGILKRNRGTQDEIEYYWYLFLKKTNELDKYYNSNIEDYNPELVEALRDKDIVYHLCNEIGYHQVELIQKDLADYNPEFEKALREKDIVFHLLNTMGYTKVSELLKDKDMHTLQYLRWKLDKSKEKSDEM